MAAADAEIEAAAASQAERDEPRKRDYEIRGEHLTGARAAQRAYYEANREKILEYQRAYYKANREKISESKRAYREANREKIAEYQRAYYKANREKISESKRAYREANREKISEYQRAGVREYRREHNMSQAALAKQVGCSQMMISFIERGEIPANEMIRERFAALGIAYG